MVISSRTPEGDPNRCPVCGHRIRVAPSRPPGDAPCPRCGHLLWFPPPEVPTESRPGEGASLKRSRRSRVRAPQERPRRPQGQPTTREPHVQATRLVRRLVRRAAGRLGEPDQATAAVLAGVREPYRAERLLALLHEARSWSELLGRWRAEENRHLDRGGQSA